MIIFVNFLNIFIKNATFLANCSALFCRSSKIRWQRKVESLTWEGRLYWIRRYEILSEKAAGLLFHHRSSLRPQLMILSISCV